jgi:hypothetical protein
MAQRPAMMATVAMLVCCRSKPAASILHRVDLPPTAEEHKVLTPPSNRLTILCVLPFAMFVCVLVRARAAEYA